MAAASLRHWHGSHYFFAPNEVEFLGPLTDNWESITVPRELPENVRPNEMSSVVKIDPEIMSGTPCFAGTRVPIQNLIDYLEGGDSIDEFLEDFPTVTREQVIAFLEEAKETVLARAV
jgi:uncharacterized protein (DUF433 family)